MNEEISIEDSLKVLVQVLESLERRITKLEAADKVVKEAIATIAIEVGKL